MHAVSEEDFKAGLEHEDKEVPLFNISGKLIHL
jgi:hypothetical protein